MAFLRVSEGTLTGKSAVISLSNPSPPASVETPAKKLDCHDPGFTCGPPSQTSAAVVLNNRGVARQDKGDLDGALQDYNEAIRLKPDYAIAFLSRGTARRVKGDLDGAIQDDNQAIRLKPDDANSFGERGIARRAKGDVEGAVRDFSEAIRLKPNDARVFVYRGEARLAKSDLDGAIQDFSAAIRGATRARKGDAVGAQQDNSRAAQLGWH